MYMFIETFDGTVALKFDNLHLADTFTPSHLHTFTLQETTILLHMAFSVARNPDNQPCIIYIDDVDKCFGGGKKAPKDGPGRLKADLAKYLDWLLPTDRVLVIGISKLASDLEGSDKDLNKCFDRKL